MLKSHFICSHSLVPFDTRLSLQKSHVRLCRVLMILYHKVLTLNCENLMNTRQRRTKYIQRWKISSFKNLQGKNRQTILIGYPQKFLKAYYQIYKNLCSNLIQSRFDPNDHFLVVIVSIWTLLIGYFLRGPIEVQTVQYCDKRWSFVLPNGHFYDVTFQMILE